METISQRLENTTDRLTDIAQALQTNIAVHEERIDNQDKLITELKTSVEKHQEDDRRVHGEMNDKLDAIKVSVDALALANKTSDKVDTFWSKANDLFQKWKYAIWGAVFAAGVLTHKAHVFEWILKFLAGDG